MESFDEFDLEIGTTEEQELRDEQKKLIMKVETSPKREYNQENVVDIDINLLVPNPYQYRLKNEEKDTGILELARSIKKDGIIQPIVVTPRYNKGKLEYIIVVGHRRVQASKKNQAKTVKAIIRKDLTDKELRILVFTENEHRLNPSKIESALVVDAAINSGDFKSIQEYANAVNKDQSYIAKLRKLLSLPEEIIEDLKNNKSTSDLVALDAIRKIKDSEIAKELYFWFISKDGSRAGLLEKIKNMKEKSEKTKKQIIEILTNDKETRFHIPKKIDKDIIKKIEKYIQKVIQ